MGAGGRAESGAESCPFDGLRTSWSCNADLHNLVACAACSPPAHASACPARPTADALIYVVDCCDRERIQRAASEFKVRHAGRAGGGAAAAGMLLLGMMSFVVLLLRGMPAVAHAATAGAMHLLLCCHSCC